jgi:hypothetical protein
MMMMMTTMMIIIILLDVIVKQLLELSCPSKEIHPQQRVPSCLLTVLVQPGVVF